MRKKGVEALLDPIKEIILAVVVLGALVGVVLMVILPSGIIASEWTCKTSVALSSITTKLGFDTIMCYTEDVKSDAKENKEALNDIAEYMRKCWNMWGEGSLNPSGKNIFYGAQEKCFTCYKISFSELEEGVSLNDINKYLQEKRDYNKIVGKETSYWNYFKKSNSANTVNVILKGKSKDENSNIIDGDKNYGVVYFENIETNKIGNVLTWSATGAGVGAVLCAFTVVGLPVCATVGGAIGGGIDAVRLFSEFGVNKLTGNVPADSIAFMDYDTAAKNCVTVVKAGEEIKINEVPK